MRRIVEVNPNTMTRGQLVAEVTRLRETVALYEAAKEQRVREEQLRRGKPVVIIEGEVIE